MPTLPAAEQLRSVRREAIATGAIWFIYGIGLTLGDWLGLYKGTKADGVLWAGLGAFAVLLLFIMKCTEAIFQKIEEATDTKTVKSSRC